MGHKVKIGNEIKDIKGGKVLINGVVKDIKGGKVLIDGVVKDIKFGTPLSELTEGTLAYVNEDGSPVAFYVAKHDYESGLNGAGRTLFVRKTFGDNDYGVWTANATRDGYENCNMDTWFTSTYLNKLDAGIQTLIGTTKIPCVRHLALDSYTLERSVFTLSCTEYGYGNVTIGTVAEEGTALPIASTLKQDAIYQYVWTRSLVMEYTMSKAWYLKYNTINIGAFTDSYWYRPAFTLPSDTLVDDNFNVIV